MKKKRIVLIFGAILTTLLMISSATAVNINQTQNIKVNTKNKNTENKNEMYVDPSIELTKKDLPKLKLAVERIEKPLYKEFTKEIIKTIEDKGILKSDGVKEILIELGMQNSEVHSGKIIGHAEWSSMCFGFPFIPLFNFWIGPSLFILWNADIFDSEDVIDYTVGVLNKRITVDHEGFGIPFTGFWSHGIYFKGQYPDGFTSRVIGRSSLIVITYR